jgi:drug/metabolite transporter (DMT)-like permease
MAADRSAWWLFAVTTLIWGSTWIGITFQLGVVAPEVSVAYRFALAAMLVAAWCRVTGRSLDFSARQHAFLALQGALLFGFNYVGVYWTERYLASGPVAVLFSTMVFMNAIGARLVFGEPLTPRTLLASTLGVAGIALLFLPELILARGGGDAALGIALGLGSTAIASGGNLVAARNQRRGIPLFPGIAWAMAYGAVVSALCGTLRGVSWSFDSRLPYVLSLLYLSVFGSIIAFGAYLTLMKKVGPGPAAYTAVSTPIVALVISTLFEHYRWTWIAGLGVVLAVIGNWLALRPTPVAHELAKIGSA